MATGGDATGGNGRDDDRLIETTRSVKRQGGPGRRALVWVLLHGSRYRLTGALVVATFGVFLALFSLGFLTPGPQGEMSTLLSSGLTSGLLTLLTVALTINQLILSRVFGTPAGLSDRLEGTRELRDRVQGLAGIETTPNDPASFLSVLARTLVDRVGALQAVVAEMDEEVPEELERYLRDLYAYGEDIDAHVEGEQPIVRTLEAIVGTGYAVNLEATDQVRQAYGGDLPEGASRELAAIEELLESIAVTRQFFKTISLQQDFGSLSRLLAASGMVAFLSVVGLTLVYDGEAATVPDWLLPWLASAVLALATLPLAALVAYLLRAATVARNTLSVGPFIPPGSRGLRW